MKFNLAEARLKTIKKLQAQADKWERYCGKAEDRLDKEMKLNEDLQEENRDLRCKYDAERLARAPRLWDELKEENKKLKEQNEYLWTPVCADDYIRLQRQFDELKQELRQKESTLHYYGCMWHVTGCDDTPTKDEIKDYVHRNVRKEDKEDVKRGLWEQFGYEEED